MESDPRLRAFDSPDAPEVFHAISHQHEIWLPDPFDVHEIHAPAREVFARTLERTSTPPGLPYGRILLLRGESGSGKTHLMRAFRNYVHSTRRGYFAYLQMTTSSRQYGRYVLQKVIDSLQKPYAQPELETPGLRLLSDALVAESPEELVNSVREEGLKGTDLAKAVFYISEDIMARERFHDIDANTLRALVYLQSDSLIVKNRVLQYLRCDPLTEFDRETIQCIAPRPDDYEPLRIVADLGRAMWAAQTSPLIVCVDQIEDVLSLDEAKERLPRVMSTMTSLADEVPSSLVVVSCLDNLYEQLRGFLMQSTIDRLERDPEPVTLTSNRSREEIDQLVAYRLRYLYETMEVAFDEASPTYPIPAEELDKLTNLPTRKVLEHCLSYRKGRQHPGESGGVPAAPRAAVAETSLIQMSQEWNDFLAEFAMPTPDTEEEQAELIAWAVEACSAEIGASGVIGAKAHESYVTVDFHSQGGGNGLFIGVCNAAARGGSLGRQVTKLEQEAKERCPVVVRSMEFPRNPKTKIARQIGRLVAGGGVRVVVEDADWRAMQAMKAFRQNHEHRETFPYWLRDEQPLARLPSLRAILNLDDVAPLPDDDGAEPLTGPVTTELPVAKQPTRLTMVLSNNPIRLGRTAGSEAAPVIIVTNDLARNVAALGGAGCGKTNLAAALIESLAIRGTPAIVIDNAGHFAAYAEKRAWQAPEEDAARLASRQTLKQRADVALYTPGNPAGRGLQLPVVPRGLQGMSVFDREQSTSTCAAAYAGLLSYGKSNRDAKCLGILKKAIEVLGMADEPAEPRLEDLVKIVDGRDPALMAALGRANTKLLEKLVQDLESLRTTKADLFGAGCETLEAEKLLGLGSAGKPGRTRLAIINTRFMGDLRDGRFWMTQLLLELNRWSINTKSERLAAVLAIEDAEGFLPAGREHATKQPLENLLRRGQSAGLCTVLLSKSPTELDFKCRDNIRTWMVGRTVQETAIKRLAPLFEEAHADVRKLDKQNEGEFQFLAEGTCTSLRTEKALVKLGAFSDEAVIKLAAAR